MTLASRKVESLPGLAASEIAATSRCPKTPEKLLDWLKARWAEEPFPEKIHSRGVFPESRLGSPALNPRFRQHLENPFAKDDDGYFLTPLHAALCFMASKSPLAAANIWAVIRQEFDWRSVAMRGGWAEEMYSMYLAKALEGLWWLYRMAPC